MESEKKQISKYIKILVMLFVIIIACNGSTIVAEINEGYATESVTGTWLNNVAGSSVLVNPIGTLFLWIAGFVQWGITTMAIAVSGQESTVMPWADAILFNAVPVLDVNFISPNAASLMSNLTKIIRTIYYTVFLISLAFFSVTILVMAIKLATESIAAKQARYKEALSKWGVALLLLFTVHFLMSFVFFLNENLVKIAAEICTKALAEQPEILQENPYYELLKKDADKFLAKNTNIEFEQRIIYAIESNPIFFGSLSSEGKEVMSDLFAFEGYVAIDIFGWKPEVDVSVNKSDAYYRMFSIYLVATQRMANGFSEEELKAMRGTDFEKKTTTINNILKEVEKQYPGNDNKLLGYLDMAKNSNASIIGKFVKNNASYDVAAETIIKYTDLYRQINQGKNRYDTGEGSAKYKKMVKNTPITQLATYFRQNSYKPRGDSYVKTDIQLPNCIMYCIFVFQSLFFFLAYIKRLFFVVVLALLAPVIIVWDFVNGI